MSSEMMSPMGFRLMSLMFWIRDSVAKPWKKLDHFGIRKGNVVVDYGAGTGAYLPHASELVGQQGKVYAVDINPTAVKACRKVAKKKGLANVRVFRAKGYKCDINTGVADVVYALDMFHAVEKPTRFLKELRRICKRKGHLILETGHQSMEDARNKVEDSFYWKIKRTGKGWFRCEPV